MSGEEILDKARALEKNLLNFFWRQGVQYGECEDLLQETYIRLWKYRDEYVPTAKFSTFAFMIAHQVRVDALRRKIRRERREEVWQKQQPADAAPQAAMMREDVRWALSRLSEPLRQVVELGIFQNLPYSEVSEILSIPVGTVKSRMSNALKRLKEEFENDERFGRDVGRAGAGLR